MMQPITVEKYADMVMQNNKGYNRADLVKSLRAALAAKKNGAKCMICGQPIWAAGCDPSGDPSEDPSGNPRNACESDFSLLRRTALKS